ncbi:YciI family protein [Fulvimonas soli]|jgi:hypothetical protein|uniref:YCII-related domain-containing protein n=1 Tax=Fulvimonas soli TaxID=155197 RepID=A0A316IET1_9GAMM|nr:YciI family protein [Fulvimonas soli]PWK92117.1 hypothetical protein C7456_103236 [Fulvimonas soli]TNY27846.1 transcription initiation protein [Fulvimonas soli]
MTRYLISFPSAAMDVPAGAIQDVADAAHAVIREARAAGVYIFSGGLDEDAGPVLVAVDGKAVEGAYPETARLSGGFTIVDVPSREAALAWAARIAAACRCPQEVRAFRSDPLA